jgi:hypothetical protein
MSLRSLSTGKQYKNVYTILEKVKKGEIKSYYNDDQGGLFGKINFYKKPNLVKPYLHYLDEARLQAVMNAEMSPGVTGEATRECYNKLGYDPKYKKWVTEKNGGSQLSFNEFNNEIRKVYNDFPKHLQDDIFNMYYNKIENVEFDERTEKNHSKYKFLERANNPVGKIMSEKSHLKSAIFMRNVMMYYLTRLALLKLTDKQAYEKMKKCMNDGNEFDNKEMDKLFDKDFGAGKSSDLMNDMIEKASELCKKMDDIMDQDAQEQMFDNISQGSLGASKLDVAYVDNMKSKLTKIKMNLGSVKEKIKRLMDKSISYFSAKKETIFENLFDTDNIGGLQDYELLHPKLRKIYIEDIDVKETKSVGKVDVYIDISGSMSDSSQINNERISKIDFAKSFAAQLKDQDLLNDIYLFNNKVKKIKNDIISIATIDTCGGTEIDGVVKKIMNNNQNAIVITDAEDRCTHYSEKAFFIGVAGADFRHFEEDCRAKYIQAGQAVVFDGNRILAVGPNGNPIK